MSTYKYIYIDDKDESDPVGGPCIAFVDYLVGYNQATIQDFIDMFEVIKKDFPQAKMDETRCGLVRQSSRVCSFSIVCWRGLIDPNKIPIGWQVVQSSPEYRW